MRQPDDLTEYEGLIYATAARYAPILDDDLEDVQQILRVKVWRARLAFDQTKTTLPERNYVFSCLRNQVKDLLKSQNRRNDARNGSQLYIEDVATSARFEVRYLGQSEDEVFQFADDHGLTLPSTLTAFERTVVGLLFLDYTQAEICRQLDAPRQKVRRAQEDVRVKMADWRPSVREPALAA